MKIKITIAILSTFLSLILLEGIGKIFNRPDPLYNAYKVIKLHSKRFWTNIPDNNVSFYKTSVITNKMGLREPDDNFNPKKNIILTLGASPTFGWGVETHFTYSSVLEKLLPNTYKVINGGMVGYSSYQGKKLFETILKKVRPQIITVSYVINDVDYFRFASNNNSPDNLVIPKSNFNILIRNILNQSDFYWLLNKWFFQNSLWKFNSNNFKQIVKNGPRVAVNSYIDNMQEIIDIARKNSIEVLFLIMPVNLPQNANCEVIDNPKKTRICFAAVCSKNAIRYNNMLKKLAIKNSIPFIDIAKEFQYNVDSYFLFAKNDPIHPNQKGHKKIAKLIYNRISKKQGNDDREKRP